MGVESDDKRQPASQVNETAREARALVRTALKGSLATLRKSTGHPYPSLVLTATDPDGTPVFLISKLAVHTQNLAGDSRASLLIDGTGDADDPMAGARVTLIGQARPTDSPTARRRFLARHPAAEGYADFADFAFYTLQPESAHFIGGFGRIVDLSAADVMTALDGAGALVDAEPGIVAHMNEDHRDAIELYATKLLSADPDVWRMTGIDPDGCDLVLGAKAVRVPFETRVTSADEARRELVRLVKVARAGGS